MQKPGFKNQRITDVNEKENVGLAETKRKKGKYREAGKCSKVETRERGTANGMISESGNNKK